MNANLRLLGSKFSQEIGKIFFLDPIIKFLNKGRREFWAGEKNFFSNGRGGQKSGTKFFRFRRKFSRENFVKKNRKVK